MKIHPRSALAAAAAAALCAGCGSGDDTPTNNVRPAWLGSVSATTYDGSSDDLLTAGLGKTGLASATAPAYANPLAPTAAELRRAAIYTNYRALLDMTAAGGYGTLYGPNVDANGTVTTGEGKIAGTEYIAFSDDGSGRKNVTLMVQLPSTFDRANPCITTATSSGSRGIYGGMSSAEWGLKKGCAVAFNDKGTGAAPHDLSSDSVPLINGTRVTAAAAGASAAFNAGLTAAQLAAFNAATPNRLAFKHAHSQQNPEADWGKYTLQAIEFALYVINERFSARLADGTAQRDFDAGNVLVIASSLSNGGGSAIAAAELDTQGLIDGVAVSEPEVVLPASPGVTVRRGSTTVATIGKPLIDYFTHELLYQPCAVLSPQLAGTPFQATYTAGFGTVAANRCASLAAKGLITGSTTAAQADAALQKLRDYGWEADSNPLYAVLAGSEVSTSIAVTYANAFSRASVADKLCGYSFASTTAAGAVNTLAPTALAQLFATGNGVPPTSGVQIVNNLNPSGPLRDVLSTSPSTSSADMNLDGALCLRNLVTGSDAAARKLQAGVDEVRRSGNLRGKPAIIVHGRADALLPVNHTSRPYVALNKVVEGGASQLSYVEVTNAQHFDTFIGNPALAGYDSRYIPLHVYLIRAMDAMYAHLKSGTALPPSQLVRTVPRGGTAGAAPAIGAANVPAWQAAPAAADAITVSGSTLTVPD